MQAATVQWVVQTRYFCCTIHNLSMSTITKKTVRNGSRLAKLKQVLSNAIYYQFGHYNLKEKNP